MCFCPNVNHHQRTSTLHGSVLELCDVDFKQMHLGKLLPQFPFSLLLSRYVGSDR